MEIMKLLNALPGAVSQGVIWGIMAIGVYITYRILDVADLTVDGSIATGGAVAAMLIISGCNAWVALVAAFVVGMLTGLVTGVFHTWMGIPAILSGILTQLALYSINLGIMSNKANTAVNANKYDLLVSLRNVRNFSLDNPILLLLIITAAVIALLYWFFGTEYGCALQRNGRKRQHGARTGHQHRAREGRRADAVQRLSGALRRAADAVSGLCGCQHGARRDCYRLGGSHHRRSAVRQDFSQFLPRSSSPCPSAPSSTTSSCRWCCGWVCPRTT